MFVGVLGLMHAGIFHACWQFCQVRQEKKSQGRDAPRFMHHHAQPSRACLSERLQLAFRLHPCWGYAACPPALLAPGLLLLSRCRAAGVLGAGPRFPRPSALRSSKIAWGSRAPHRHATREKLWQSIHTAPDTHAYKFQMCSLHFACSSWYVYAVAASLRLVPYQYLAHSSIANDNMNCMDAVLKWLQGSCLSPTNTGARYVFHFQENLNLSFPWERNQLWFGFAATL